MQYPHIIDDALALVSMGALAGLIIWMNLDARNPEKIAAEKARQEAMTEEQRTQEALEDWANKNAC